MRILLAEDDELLGSGIRAGLAQNGFQVDWVRDGVAAERELATGAYQAAVLDLGLPRLDGMEVLRQVRARRTRCGATARPWNCPTANTTCCTRCCSTPGVS